LSLSRSCGRCTSDGRRSGTNFAVANSATTSQRQADGKGKGLFAQASIAKGALIIEYCGELIDAAEYERRMDDYKVPCRVSRVCADPCSAGTAV
jgi:hypothetical protein